MPATFISSKLKKRVLGKFKSMAIHKRCRPLKEVASLLAPVIRRVINYYHKFWDRHMYKVCYQINQRLLKWVKWEKGMYEYAAIRWLKQQYKETPNLFPHWRFVHPNNYIVILNKKSRVTGDFHARFRE
jgi:hypothetical protein